MAFSLGSVVAKIEADISGFEQGMKRANSAIGGMKDGINRVNDSLSGFRNTMAIVGGVTGFGLVTFLNEAKNEAKQFETAMIGLDIIAGRFGITGQKAKDAAIGLGRELRIGTGAAADSLQNLIKSGLSLDDSVELLRRFTNEALTGKSASISLSQAVQNLSFAYATNNSALGNLSGINENFQDIIKRGEQALLAQGVAASDITEDMAKFKGMMDLTNLTLGSSARLAGTLADQEAVLEQQKRELLVTVGQQLNPVMSEFISMITESGVIEDMGTWAREVLPKVGAELIKFANWVRDNQDLVIGFLKALAAAIIALSVASAVASVLAMLTNPIYAIIAAITALVFAWNTNLFGMRDGVMYLVELFRSLWWWIVESVKALVEWPKIVMNNLANSIGSFVHDMFRRFVSMRDGVISVINSLLGWLGGVIGWLHGWGRQIYDAFAHPFKNAWEYVKNVVNNIKNALDFTKRHSPSVLDIINTSVKKANKALSGLQVSQVVMPNASTIASNLGFNNDTNMTQVVLNLPNAIISDEAGARRIGEIVGDNIVKRLQTNVRI